MDKIIGVSIITMIIAGPGRNDNAITMRAVNNVYCWIMLMPAQNKMAATNDAAFYLDAF